MSLGAAAVARGCGTRKAGGVYGELGLADPDQGGMPLEEFLMDPPRPVDHLPNLTPVGVSMIEHEGTWHILDWIGQMHYPEVTDFIEEVRRFGLSRRLPETLDFSRLSPQSRILCVHRKAWMSPETCNAIRPPIKRSRPKHYHCPSGEKGHVLGGKVTCLGCCWDSVAEGEDAEEWDDTYAVPRKIVTRQMPSFSYNAVVMPEGLRPEYKAAIFGSFPMSRIAVVRSAHSKHATALTKARDAIALPVEEVDE